MSGERKRLFGKDIGAGTEKVVAGMVAVGLLATGIVIGREVEATKNDAPQAITREAPKEIDGLVSGENWEQYKEQGFVHLRDVKTHGDQDILDNVRNEIQGLRKRYGFNNVTTGTGWDDSEHHPYDWDEVESHHVDHTVGIYINPKHQEGIQV